MKTIGLLAVVLCLSGSSLAGICSKLFVRYNAVHQLCRWCIEYHCTAYLQVSVNLYARHLVILMVVLAVEAVARKKQASKYVTVCSVAYSFSVSISLK